MKLNFEWYCSTFLLTLSAKREQFNQVFEFGIKSFS
jgi:hypothetical protein